MQVNYQINPQNKAQADAMSNHNAEVYPNAGMVSQNLQGPYAIRKTKTGFWLFDLPNVSDTPPSGSEVEYRRVLKILTQLTGMNETDSTSLLDAMIDDNEKARTGHPGYATTTLLNQLKAKLGYLGIGDELVGKISIESNSHYADRTDSQIRHLKGSLQPSADVLMFQQQPYDTQADLARVTSFKQIMSANQYTCVASIPGRNIGIWVSSHLANSFKKPRYRKLVSMIEGHPFNGCVTQGPDTIYINLYGSSHDIPFDVYIAKLCELSKAVNEYAKNRKLKICLNGDLNLHGALLKPNHINDLQNAGFILIEEKGHEPRDGKAKKNPTMEGCIKEDKYYRQRYQIPQPAPNFGNIKTHLQNAWKYVEKSLDNDELINKIRLPKFSDYINIKTLLADSSAPLNPGSIKSLYQHISQVLETRTVRYMTTPTLYGALVDFKVQVASAHAAASPPDEETHAIMDAVLDEFKKFISYKTSHPTEGDKHTGLVEINKKLAQITGANSYQQTVASLMMIANECRDRLNYKYNFWNKLFRDDDVANIYDLFTNNPVLKPDINTGLEYNTNGLETILLNLESLNRSHDRVVEAYHRSGVVKKSN